jgi:hypothetical protein
MKNNTLKLFFLLFLVLCSVIPSTCKKLEKEMLVSTGEITNILTNSAEASGQVIDLGDGATQSGHCYAKTPNVNVDGSKTQLGVPAGTVDFTSQLTNLEAGTLYYIKAYLSNGNVTVYGKEISFTTTPASVPTLSTTAITSIAQTSASSGGNITSDGGATVTARGVCWNTATGPTIANSKTSDGTGSGSFSSSLTGLTGNTIYYVRAYATNSAGTAYGNEQSFTTSPVVPALSTTAISGITKNTATSGGNITSDGGALVTARGVCWNTSIAPTTSNSKTTDATGSGSFSSSLTGLTASTTYYVRAYATNSAGTAYGNELSFTTSSVIPVVPTLSTTAISSITATTATSGGNITNDGGATVTSRGVCWNTTTGPTTANSKTNDLSGTGSFVSNLVSLTGNTTYYVRAYATNSAGTAYGNELSFTTSPVVPTLSTTTITSITTNTAISGGNITSDGGASVTARGICWSTAFNPTEGNNHTTDGTGTGSFVSSLTGLTLNTTYYVRAYATNSTGTGYGNELSFTTSAAVVPTLSTRAITSITTTTAASGGNITDDGGASVTSRGVCWNTSPNPTTVSSKTYNGFGTGSFTGNLTGLTGNTTYYVRAYATNSAGTAYGNEISFKTSAVVSTLTTTAVTSVTASTASSGGNIADDGGATITARGVC